MADRAFATPEGKAALDSLTHPAIVARIRAAKQAAQTAGAPPFCAGRCGHRGHGGAGRVRPPVRGHCTL
ncbi:MAG: hypothetical protein ACLVJH_09155 [Faecalibacterium prausnitzii]